MSYDPADRAKALRERLHVLHVGDVEYLADELRHAWDAAIEEAAEACALVRRSMRETRSVHPANAAGMCAEAIRALKSGGV